MSKKIAISLLILFSINFLSLLCFEIGQFAIRLEMTKELENTSDFQVVKMNKDVFLKCKISEHDLKINGKFYDFVQLSESVNELTIKVVQDSKEEELFSFFENFISKNENPQNPNSLPFQVLKFLSLAFIIPKNNFEFSFTPDLQENNLLYCLHYQSITIDSLCPPPMN